MANTLLDTPRAERVRRVARLSQKKTRRETGLFLVEGPQSVRELLAHRPELVREVYATDEALDRHTEFRALAAAARTALISATPAVITAMCDAVTPQGIVAVAEQFPADITEWSRGATDGSQPSGPLGLVAILHEVRDPGNAGAVLRVADAAGADAVVFTGESVDPFSPKVVRSTAGSLFHLPVVIEASLPRALAAVRDRGLQVVAADVHGEDFVPASRDGRLATPTAWVFGNEARGLTPEQRALADVALRLPIYGSAESLNLATAASVCLYASAFAQRS